MSAEQAPSGSKRGMWIVVAIIVVVGAAAGAIALANRSDSGVANGSASAITTSSSAAANTTPSITDSASSSVAVTTAPPAATPTTARVLTTKPPTTKPATPKPTVAPTLAPTLAVTSVKANVTTYPCSSPTPHYIILTWSTTLADSMTIGIDNPGTYAADLPPSGSLTDVPFSACPGGSVTYYFIAKKANGDQITRTLTVNAGT